MRWDRYDPFDAVLAETTAALNGIAGVRIDAACAMIAGAGTIVLYGCGREGLMMQALALFVPR